MNIQDLYDAHELINDYFFKGMLNHPKFKLAKELKWDTLTHTCEEYEYFDSMDAWGYYEHPGKIAITDNENWVTILLHEMIHQYQYEFDLPDKNHGTIFYDCSRFMEHELNLEKGTIEHIVMDP